MESSTHSLVILIVYLSLYLAQFQLELPSLWPSLCIEAFFNLVCSFFFCFSRFSTVEKRNSMPGSCSSNSLTLSWLQAVEHIFCSCSFLSCVPFSTGSLGVTTPSLFARLGDHVTCPTYTVHLFQILLPKVSCKSNLSSSASVPFK